MATVVCVGNGVCDIDGGGLTRNTVRSVVENGTVYRANGMARNRISDYEI